MNRSISQIAARHPVLMTDQFNEDEVQVGLLIGLTREKDCSMQTGLKIVWQF